LPLFITGSSQDRQTFSRHLLLHSHVSYGRLSTDAIHKSSFIHLEQELSVTCC